MAPKSSSTAKKSSGQGSQQAKQSQVTRKRTRDSPSMRTRTREIYDEKVADAHLIKPEYNKLKLNHADEAEISKFLSSNGFSSDREYLEYLRKPLRIIIPGDEDTLTSVLKKGKGEVVPEKSISKEISPKGSRQKGHVDKGKGEESKDDDEYLFNNFTKFTPRLARREGYTDRFFMHSDHKNRFETFRERGIMPHKVFDLDYLDSVGIPLKMHLKRCKMDFFVKRKAPILPDMIAYFYSILFFNDANSLCYKMGEKVYIVRDDELAKIMGVTHRKFTPIDIQAKEAFAYLTGKENFSRDSKAHIAYDDFPLKHILMHKIVIECLRPKASSKTDTSRFEAKLMWALLTGYKFSLAHVVILHMYRTVQKNKGQLPYAGLIYDILRYHKIIVPDRFSKNRVPIKTGGAEMLQKMGFRQKDGRWFNKSREVPVELEKEERPAKKRKIMAKDSKSKGSSSSRTRSNSESDDETPTASPKEQGQVEASQIESGGDTSKEQEALLKSPAGQAEERERPTEAVAEAEVQMEGVQMETTSEAALETPAQSQGENLRTDNVHETDEDAEFERQVEAATLLSLLDARLREDISTPVQEEVSVKHVFSTLLRDLGPARRTLKTASQSEAPLVEDQPQPSENVENQLVVYQQPSEIQSENLFDMALDQQKQDSEVHIDVTAEILYTEDTSEPIDVTPEIQESVEEEHIEHELPDPIVSDAPEPSAVHPENVENPSVQETPAASVNLLHQIQQDIRNLKTDLQNENQFKQEIRDRMQSFERKVETRLDAMEVLVKRTCDLLCAKIDDLDNFTLVRTKKTSTPQTAARQDDDEPSIS